MAMPPGFEMSLSVEYGTGMVKLSIIFDTCCLKFDVKVVGALPIGNLFTDEIQHEAQGISSWSPPRGDIIHASSPRASARARRLSHPGRPLVLFGAVSCHGYLTSHNHLCIFLFKVQVFQFRSD